MFNALFSRYLDKVTLVEGAMFSKEPELDITFRIQLVV